MAGCPYCETALQLAVLGGREVRACRECGGVWVSAADLTAVVKDAPAELAPFSDAWPDRGGQPPLNRPEPTCAECGAELAARTFPVAPNLPILTCAACKRLFFSGGQLRRLHEIVSPDTLRAPAPLMPPPVMAPEPEADGEPEVRAGAAWSWTWPERDNGQPWLSWAVLGTPLWVLLLVLLVIGAAQAITFAATIRELDTTGTMAGMAWLNVPGMYVFWLLRSLVATLVLMLTWQLSDGSVQLSFGETYRLMLRVTTLLLLLSWLLGLLALTGLPAPALIVLRIVCAALIYRQILELEWNEVGVLAVANWLVGLFLRI